MNLESYKQVSKAWLVIPPVASLLKDIVATNLVLSGEPGITAKATQYYAVAMLPGSWMSGESPLLWNLVFGGLLGLISYLGVIWLQTRETHSGGGKVL